jgi:hypothetical protein
VRLEAFDAGEEEKKQAHWRTAATLLRLEGV